MRIIFAVIGAICIGLAFFPTSPTGELLLLGLAFVWGSAVLDKLDTLAAIMRGARQDRAEPPAMRPAKVEKLHEDPVIDDYLRSKQARPQSGTMPK